MSAGKAWVAGMWVSSLLDPLQAVFEALAGQCSNPPAPHPVPVVRGAVLHLTAISGAGMMSAP